MKIKTLLFLVILTTGISRSYADPCSEKAKSALSVALHNEKIRLKHVLHESNVSAIEEAVNESIKSYFEFIRIPYSTEKAYEMINELYVDHVRFFEIESLPPIPGDIISIEFKTNHFSRARYEVEIAKGKGSTPKNVGYIQGPNSNQRLFKKSGDIIENELEKTLTNIALKADFSPLLFSSKIKGYIPDNPLLRIALVKELYEANPNTGMKVLATLNMSSENFTDNLLDTLGKIQYFFGRTTEAISAKVKFFSASLERVKNGKNNGLSIKEFDTQLDFHLESIKKIINEHTFDGSYSDTKIVTALEKHLTNLFVMSVNDQKLILNSAFGEEFTKRVLSSEMSGRTGFKAGSSVSFVEALISSLTTGQTQRITDNAAMRKLYEEIENHYHAGLE